MSTSETCDNTALVTFGSASEDDFLVAATTCKKSRVISITLQTEDTQVGL